MLFFSQRKFNYCEKLLKTLTKFSFSLRKSKRKRFSNYSNDFKTINYEQKETVALFVGNLCETFVENLFDVRFLMENHLCSSCAKSKESLEKTGAN